MKKRPTEQKYVVCIKNTGYKTSLVVRRIYPVIPDAEARKHSLLRVVDESGEDYLFPERLFVPIELPKTVGKMFSTAT